MNKKLKNILYTEPKTKDEARQLAMDYQEVFSTSRLSYSEIATLQEHLKVVACKFHLIREFKENAII